MKKIFLSSLIGFFLCAPVNAEVIEGKVVKVADGDTITIVNSVGYKQKIRLQAIDAPETQQAFGKICSKQLSEKVMNANVIIEYEKKDQYGRLLGTVWLGERDINLEQIAEGCAWYYDHYKDQWSVQIDEEYTRAQNYAQNNRLGLWKQKNPMNPYQFRKMSRRH